MRFVSHEARQRLIVVGGGGAGEGWDGISHDLVLARRILRPNRLAAQRFRFPFVDLVMERIGEAIWLLRYPLKIMGLNAGRRVCIIRLASGKLVIHSTGPFSDHDRAAIGQLGEPGWILDAMLDHDTFGQAGRAAYPGIPYLGPSGLDERVGFKTEPLAPAPSEWREELLVLELRGAPSFSEHVLLHEPSGTLIVCDLLLNFPSPQGLWPSLLLTAAVGRQRSPGVSRRLRLAITDRDAFKDSIRALLRWDFDRIVVGHGEPIRANGKQLAAEAFERARLL